MAAGELIYTGGCLARKGGGGNIAPSEVNIVQ